MSGRPEHGEYDQNQDIIPAGNYNEKNAQENIGTEEASLALKPDQVAVTNSYDVDPFAANHESAREDYLEFRTMGWLNAGLIGTAEVCLLSCYNSSIDDRVSRLVYSLSLRFSNDWVS